MTSIHIAKIFYWLVLKQMLTWFHFDKENNDEMYAKNNWMLLMWNSEK